MKFGPVAPKKAIGAILAHSVDTDTGKLKKGRILDVGDIAALEQSGVKTIIAARLSGNDIAEDAAAEQIARSLALSSTVTLDQPFTGRVNLYAAQSGVLMVDRKAVDAINLADPGITLATLANHTAVEEGRMVATVKIIPFSLPRSTIQRVVSHAHEVAAIEVAPYMLKKTGLVATTLPSLKPSILDKTRQILKHRLAASANSILHEERVVHDATAIAEAIGKLKKDCDLIIIFGASATSDIDDVIPTGLRLAGGVVEHFGMPVDPGNLLMLGHLDKVSVIGAPGCARSASENGFDWVLQRILAGVTVTNRDISEMGVGGLLKEIHSRPQPRQEPQKSNGNMRAVILAGGQSQRMGRANKLLARFDGISLVRKVAKATLNSRAAGVTVVTGHQAASIEAALEGLDVEFVHNSAFASGLASSLISGIASLPADCDGALILLADMPQITTAMTDRMIEAHDEAADGAIIHATSQGKRGNPVLWPARYFDQLKELSGDVGARHLIAQNAEKVIEVELGEAAAADVDTLPMLHALGGKLAGEDNE